MEISSTSASTASAATNLSLPTPPPHHHNPPKSPDSDPSPIEQTPPIPTAAVFTSTTRIQPAKPSQPLTNGVLKRHTPPPTTTYKECLKNHAASIGGHALDGCGEFMPSPNTIPTDPTSLKCAACGCHRNFHRREPEELSSLLSLSSSPQPLPLSSTATNHHHVIEYHPHHRHHPPPPPPPPHQHIPPPRSPNSQSPPPISSSYAPHMLLALSDGAVHHHHQQQLHPHPRHTSTYSRSLSHNSAPTAGHQGGRKRFRTKFTPDQKERMHEFAEKVGWKMQKCNDEMVADFCNQVGVERGVLKVWMHNNKNTYGKRDFNGNLIGGEGESEIRSLTLTQHQHQHQHRHEEEDDDGDGEMMKKKNNNSSSEIQFRAGPPETRTLPAAATTIG